ncbi:MAG TPA: DUF1592 domain-containing protein [Polyangiaceae bacterium]|nr:DUF1592 domain-containing protein [Polyangiaceae bacterium]
MRLSERLLQRRPGSASGCFSALLLLACTGEVEPLPGDMNASGSAGRPAHPEAGGQSVEPGGGTSSSKPSGSSGGSSGAATGGAPLTGGAAGANTSGANTAVCEPGEISAAPAKLRRLTPEEYANTARDLVGEKAKPELEQPVGDVIGALEVEKLGQAAHDLAVLGGHHEFVPCAIDGKADAACARSFITKFGARAFRRPLSSEEQSWLEGVYQKLGEQPEADPAFTFRERIDALAEVILQAPQHVYVEEVGVADAALPDGVRRLTGYERATRLSYLIWGSTPDEELTKAAASGALDTASGVRAAAERLLANPRAKQMARRFASRWLGLDAETKHPALEDLPKSAERFPFDGTKLRAALRTETEALYERAFFAEGDSFRALLTSRDAYVNADLASLYGVAFPGGESEFAWVELPERERAGLFTRAAFLSAYAGAEYQSPIRRGVFLLRKVLCQTLPDPPPDADNTPPAPSRGDQARTIRELTEIKTSGGSCTSCHSVINPFGFAFEHYGAIGQYQAEETGTFQGKPYELPVNASTEVRGGDVHGAVTDALELSRLLADSAQAHDCAVDGWFERALSRRAMSDDACWLSAVKEQFRASSNLKELVLALASSDAALHIREATP